MCMLQHAVTQYETCLRRERDKMCLSRQVVRGQTVLDWLCPLPVRLSGLDV